MPPINRWSTDDLHLGECAQHDRTRVNLAIGQGFELQGVHHLHTSFVGNIENDLFFIFSFLCLM